MSPSDPAATPATTLADASAPDPARLRSQIDALLLDPRGRFRPRALALSALGSEAADCLVMLVGVSPDGCLSVVTEQAMGAGLRYAVEEAVDPGERLTVFNPGAEFMVRESRAGHRPEDDATPCWISVLAPAGGGV